MGGATLTGRDGEALDRDALLHMARQTDRALAAKGLEASVAASQTARALALLKAKGTTGLLAALQPAVGAELGAMTKYWRDFAAAARPTLTQLAPQGDAVVGYVLGWVRRLAVIRSADSKARSRDKGHQPAGPPRRRS